MEVADSHSAIPLNTTGNGRRVKRTMSAVGLAAVLGAGTRKADALHSPVRRTPAMLPDSASHSDERGVEGAKSGDTAVSKARFGIVVLAFNSATEVVESKHAYLHPWFCPEVDWPDMLMDAADQAAVDAVREAAAAATYAVTSKAERRYERSHALQSVVACPSLNLSLRRRGRSGGQKEGVDLLE